MRQIVLIAHNIRSTHNVGSLLRTAEGLGIEQVYLTGYTPYPRAPGDNRLPHLAIKLDKSIHKTALGAEKSIDWHYKPDPLSVLRALKQAGYELTALEQTATAQQLNAYKASERVAIIVGNEITGLDDEVLKAIKTHLQIPMHAKKESFNVAVAAAIALYHLRFS